MAAGWRPAGDEPVGDRQLLAPVAIEVETSTLEAQRAPVGVRRRTRRRNRTSCRTGRRIAARIPLGHDPALEEGQVGHGHVRRLVHRRQPQRPDVLASPRKTATTSPPSSVSVVPTKYWVCDQVHPPQTAPARPSTTRRTTSQNTQRRPGEGWSSSPSSSAAPRPSEAAARGGAVVGGGGRAGARWCGPRRRRPPGGRSRAGSPGRRRRATMTVTLSGAPQRRASRTRFSAGRRGRRPRRGCRAGCRG